MNKIPSDKDILTKAATIKKRDRSEWCKLVHWAVKGRTMQGLASLLGYKPTWVAEHLKRYSLEAVSGGSSGDGPQIKVSNGEPIKSQITKLISEFAPTEINKEYIEKEEEKGHTPEVAKCLAKAHEAGENAIKAGVLVETLAKSKERSLKIILPPEIDWHTKLVSICASVQRATVLLDRAQISDLRKEETYRKIMLAHDKWMEQVERIKNFHPIFEETK